MPLRKELRLDLSADTTEQAEQCAPQFALLKGLSPPVRDDRYP
jgi:hypothetical protein